MQGTTLLLVVLSLYAAGCSKTYEIHTLDNRSGAQEFELNVSPEASEADLRIRATVKSGNIRWTLTTPEGELVSLDSEGTGSSQGTTRHFVAPEPTTSRISAVLQGRLVNRLSRLEVGLAGLCWGNTATLRSHRRLAAAGPRARNPLPLQILR